ncbi:MAG TPA: sensor histidine kinase KdpD [Myxococcota bacterium]|nr:sensor histidine kinase KdpD [Myxococcota bacterium]
MSDERPDPDALLQRVRRDEADAKRGRLKVFFGAAPGVGKTYAMLEAARAKRTAGAEVVIGWVETHGRAETAALAEGFERLPPREVEHRGVRLLEFDIDKALARKPGLLLLDELAHTNAPGARHPKRWQDARELVQAGTSVWTTLNVQHLESVNDLVERITGVVVRETLPDRLLDEADEVEFVDLPPEDLLRRLEEGKVYLPDQAARAVKQFFRKGNLTALRELALRRTAEHVDVAVQDYRRDHAIEATWPIAERLLVCIRPNPDSGRLVRAARRLATRLRAEWIVAWVDSPGQPTLSAAERGHLAAAFELAEQLGAETASVSGASIPSAVLQLARERNVSQIVVGKPRRSAGRSLLRGSLVDAIVKLSGDIDVFIVTGEEAERPAPALAARRSRPIGYALAALVVLAASLVSWAMGGRFDKLNLAMVYLLGIVFVATRYGRGPSLLAVLLSVAAFDFFFVPPHLTFAVSDTQYLVSFAVMLVVGLLVSTLAARVREAAEFAQNRERRTQALFALSRELAGPLAPRELARIGARHVSDLLRSAAVLFLPAPGRGLERVGDAVPAFARDPHEHAVAQWAFDHRQAAGADTDTLPGGGALYEPLVSGDECLGVLGIELLPSVRPLPPDQRELVRALCRQLAGPLERTRLAESASAARLAVESERLRSTLLSSVSHDLRTPLAAITGAASGLVVEPEPPPALRQELAATVLEEAERLNRLVGNLLDMTRLEAGTLEPKREWHSLEELVGGALARVERYAGGRALVAQVAPDLPLVPIDGVLVEQALVNLLENALRHGGREGAVRVSAQRDGAQALVEVKDDGPGFPPGEAERLFDKFYRAAGGPGAGLGLAIARAIVTAHGGRIWAQAGEPRGATFAFTLPLGDAPPPPAPPAQEA